VFVIRVVVGLLPQKAPLSPTQDEEALRTRALKLHYSAIVVDTHNDVPTWMLDFGFDLGMSGDEPDDRYPRRDRSTKPNRGACKTWLF
jgi:hypothetical protein